MHDVLRSDRGCEPDHLHHSSSRSDLCRTRCDPRSCDGQRFRRSI
jgi:hypothetical protein